MSFGFPSRSSRLLYRLFDITEEISAFLQIHRSPDLFKNINSTQSLQPRFSEPVLLIQKASLEPHRASHEVRDIYRVQLGTFNMSMRVVEPAPVEKQLRQAIIVPKLVKIPAERGCYPEGCLEVANRLFRVALGEVY